VPLPLDTALGVPVGFTVAINQSSRLGFTVVSNCSGEVGAVAKRDQRRHRPEAQAVTLALPKRTFHSRFLGAPVMAKTRFGGCRRG
jgi:hypothetical protein